MKTVVRIWATGALLLLVLLGIGVATVDYRVLNDVLLRATIYLLSAWLLFTATAGGWAIWRYLP